MAKTFGISDHWPEVGRIQFVDFRLRYGVDLPYVLDGVTFDVRANETVGVVGRTGSGQFTASLMHWPRDGTGSLGHRVRDFGRVGSGQCTCQTRCLTRFCVLACAFIAAFFLRSNTISAN